MDILLVISLILHLVATAVWIGGLLLMSFIVFPESRKLIENREGGAILTEFLDRVRKRFHPMSNLSLLVLIVTGLYQTSVNPNYKGLLEFTNDWTRAILWKHVAVVGMVMIGGVMQWGVIPGIERAALRLKAGRAAPELMSLRQRERLLTAINCALGVIVLIFTGIATAL